MKTNAALLWEQPGKWTVEEVELDPPRTGEVLVEMVATGLCHSDDHFATGDVPLPNLPVCAGHEGSGIVREVGPGVNELAVGDRIVTMFVPACGRCRWCSSGLQQLCDAGATVLRGAQLDNTFRMHVQGKDVSTTGMLGTFAQWQVFDQRSCVRVPDDVPLENVGLLGCGVTTGWGSAVNSAAVRAGDVVIVMGVGGVGMSAVQGAAMAGAAHVVAVDPVAFKTETARDFGATEGFSTMAEATDFVRSITNGQGADSAIVTVGVISGDHINEAFTAIRKAGTVVLTSQGAVDEVGLPINLFEISMYQKRIQGALYGGVSPRRAIPELVDLYRQGRLRLDEMATRRYHLDQVNEAFADMHAGHVVRGMIDLQQ